LNGELSEYRAYVLPASFGETEAAE